MAGSDSTRIELDAPLPGNALHAVVAFKASRLGRDRDVPRADATHAELTITALDGRTRTRTATLDEADAFLRDAEAIAQRDRAWAADGAAARERAAAERTERARSIRLDCPHCGVPRTYEGRRDLVSLLAPAEAARLDDPGRARPQTRAYEEYACPRCGSVELFKPGVLDHPLSG